MGKGCEPQGRNAVEIERHMSLTVAKGKKNAMEISVKAGIFRL